MMTNLKDMLLPYSYNLYNKRIDEQISLEEIIFNISRDRYLRSLVALIQQEEDPQQQKNYKSRLPLFYPAIKLHDYKKISANEQVKSTGLIHFDIDIYNKNKTDQFYKQLIKKIPSLVYAFRSPRNGLKFAIASNYSEQSKEVIRRYYSQSYQGAKKMIQDKIPDLVFDNTSERISQSCYLSSDPQLYINYTPEIFSTSEFIQIDKQLSKDNTRTQTITRYTTDKALVLEALSYIPSNMPYHDRFRINMAITAVFGYEAETILLNHWQHENYAKLMRDINTQVRYAQTHTGSITAGTLFYYAKQYGFKFASTDN